VRCGVCVIYLTVAGDTDAKVPAPPYDPWCSLVCCGSGHIPYNSVCGHEETGMYIFIAPSQYHPMRVHQHTIDVTIVYYGHDT
jgi:hypothetical protein